MVLYKNLTRVFVRPAFSRAMSSSLPAVVAVLYQAIDPPEINGVKKPRKPGGYKDSGSDIAYILQQRNIQVITPSATPSPTTQEGWCFPDTEDGILSAVQRGATHLWANTIVFASHPLQISSKLSPHLRVVGQPPILTEIFDDKAYLNQKLSEANDSFPMPRSWRIDAGNHNAETVIKSIDQYPIVAKPVRGRGSYGVKMCRTRDELEKHVATLLPESPVVLLEEYLAGQEATMTVMPPDVSSKDQHHWCLPPVVRFSHVDGVAPYSGTVAVTANSRAVMASELEADSTAYGDMMDQCARVGDLIKTTAPIRIDVRRRSDGSEFVLFDINMKPACSFLFFSFLFLLQLTFVQNMTGPGRPGREDQASLTALAAAELGWDYPTLLLKILQQARTLGELRDYKSPFE